MRCLSDYLRRRLDDEATREQDWLELLSTATVVSFVAKVGADCHSLKAAELSVVVIVTC